MKKISFLLSILFILSIVSCDKVVDNNSGVNDPNVPREDGRTHAGYEYVHHIDNNTEKPQFGDQVKYHKIVYKNDTTLLQSTYMLLEPRADVLPHRDSVPSPPHPTYDALFLMSPGDSLTVYQSLDTFPAETLPDGITNEDHFTYVIKMLSIKSKEVIEKEIADVKGRAITVADSLKNFIDDFKAGKLDDQIIRTETNLKYIIHKEGKGEKVKDGGFVKVHYLGMLENGDIFDATFHTAEPFARRIGRGRVIAGWDEGIPLLNEGSEATFIIPYQLAYGVAGKPPGIPERTDLYFYISLINVY